MTQQGLSDAEAAILDFETEHPGVGPAKERAIREAFGASPARYYGVLNTLIDRPDAAAHAPAAVRRLRERRDRARDARSSDRLGLTPGV